MAETPPLVRRAHPADVDSLIEVHVSGRTAYYRGVLSEDDLARDNAAARERGDGYRRRIAADDSIVLCADLDEEVAGFAMSVPCQHPDPAPAVDVELNLLFVRPRRFRQGIASALHGELVHHWADAGLTAARLWVWEFNDPARWFYLSHGWVADGHVRPDDPRIGEHRMLGYRLDIPAAR